MLKKNKEIKIWLKMNSDDHYKREKRFYDRKTITLRGFHHLTKFFTLSWLSDILELKKRLIIWVGGKGIRRVSKTFTVFNTFTRQLFLYYKISFGKSYANSFLDIPSLICFLRSFPLSSNALFWRFKFLIARDASDIT